MCRMDITREMEYLLTILVTTQEHKQEPKSRPYPKSNPAARDPPRVVTHKTITTPCYRNHQAYIQLRTNLYQPPKHSNTTALLAFNFFSNLESPLSESPSSNLFDNQEGIIVVLLL